MRQSIVLSIFIFFFLTVGCQKVKYKGFYTTQKGIIHKLIFMGEGKTNPQIKDLITIDFSYSTMRDSVFFKAKKKFVIDSPAYSGAIEDCFMMMSEGDSSAFLLLCEAFFNRTLLSKIPSFLSKSDSIIIRVKMLEIQSQEDYLKQKREFLSWAQDFGDYEKVFLQHYLEQEKINEAPTKSGLYKILKKKGNALKPEKGDTVTVDYEGKFLNGKYFDSTKKRKSNFEFVFGTEWQVVKGLEEAIGMMTEGEKAVFIMPSGLAFGEEGSSNNVVPPYTSVIFEVELLRISKGDSVIRKRLYENDI